MLFGRRIRITVGNIVVCDIDPLLPEISATRSLDVSFTTEMHTKLEPLATTVTVIGLNRIVRAQMILQQAASKAIAWEEYQKVLTGALAITEEELIFQVQQQLVFNGLQVLVEAGYQSDFGVLANAQALPDGIVHDTSGVPTTTITAQDGRYPWQNAFVSEECAPGVTYLDWTLVEQLSEGFLTGALSAAEVVSQSQAQLLVRKNFAGYLNGRVLDGDGSARVAEIAETLGLTPFFDRGNRVWLDTDAVTLDEAVLLQLTGPELPVPVPNPGGGLLSHTEPDSRGFVQVHCLLNHRLTPGRQVLVFDALGVPVGAGVFRCEYVKHTGSTHDVAFHSDAILRPVTIPRATNV